MSQLRTRLRYRALERQSKSKLRELIALVLSPYLGLMLAEARDDGRVAMYSLHLCCTLDEVDLLSGELWEAGTIGVREIENGSGSALLIATFETNTPREDLLRRFPAYSPRWELEEEKDWVQATRDAWPGRRVGSHLFLAAYWCTEPTPAQRKRVIHNPGLASGTGEHPCTLLALEALELTVKPGFAVADVGTGSGILAISASKLGAAFALGTDLDEVVLQAAKENYALNAMKPNLIAGSADCIQGASMDVVVANINASVLLSIADDLLSIVRPGGILILTGFPAYEANAIEQVFPPTGVSTLDGWNCVISRISSHA